MTVEGKGLKKTTWKHYLKKKPAKTSLKQVKTGYLAVKWNLLKCETETGKFLYNEVLRIM